jgi:tetratricopeptide (TPR) repeat protein
MSKTAHELTRKEMKGPDRFQVAASDAAHWMAQRQKLLLVGAAVVLAVALGVVGVFSYVESRQAGAGGQLYRAIDAAGGEVSTIPLPNLDRPVYKTAEERARAVLATAEQLRSRHGGTRAATTAALLEGDAQLALREWDRAIAAYKAFLDAAPSDDVLRFAALDGTARAQEGKGDLGAAAAAYEQAAGIGFYKDRATLERARVLAKAGKLDEARKAVESVSKDAKDPALQAEAQERLARLGGK